MREWDCFRQREWQKACVFCLFRFFAFVTSFLACYNFGAFLIWWNFDWIKFFVRSLVRVWMCSLNYLHDFCCFRAVVVLGRWGICWNSRQIPCLFLVRVVRWSGKVKVCLPNGSGGFDMFYFPYCFLGPIKVLGGLFGVQISNRISNIWNVVERIRLREVPAQ